MATWKQFAAAAPDLGAAGRALLYRTWRVATDPGMG